MKENCDRNETKIIYIKVNKIEQFFVEYYSILRYSVNNCKILNKSVNPWYFL